MAGKAQGIITTGSGESREVAGIAVSLENILSRKARSVAGVVVVQAMKFDGQGASDWRPRGKSDG